MNTGYKTIFFDDGAPYQKYFGWKVIDHELDLRILTKNRGPVRRCLLLVSGAPPDEINAKIRRFRLIDARTDLILHDFQASGGENRIIAGREWSLASSRARMLNIATFVIDLAYNDNTLLKFMSGDCRRKIRKAREAGILVTATRNPSEASLAQFMSSFKKMASERGLMSPSHSVLKKMFDGGDLTLFRALSGEETRTAITVYRAGEKAIFMMGVGGDKRNDGSAQLLHFEVMRQLRAQEVRWYDLGGVPSTHEGDGIYRFKKGFGGEFVSLGCEYLYRPTLVRTLAGLKSRLAGRTV